MRLTFALAAAAALAFAGVAQAETWTKYVEAPNGTAWSYDADYTYKDKASGRLVVMQAVSKPAANLGPSGPGKPDGVGSVIAIDCGKKNVIVLGAYTPSKPLALKANWRSDTPKKANEGDDAALMAAVCPHVDHVPVK